MQLARQHRNPSQKVTKPSCQVEEIATKAQDINTGAPKMCKTSSADDQVLVLVDVTHVEDPARFGVIDPCWI